MATLKSGQLAKQANINTETLRYYEREGLLPEPERTEAGYRLYHDDDVKRVLFIKRAQELGFSLKEIKELLELRLDKTKSAKAVKLLTENKIQIINEKINALHAIKSTLIDLSNACSGEGSVLQCPIINSLDKKGDKTYE